MRNRHTPNGRGLMGLAFGWFIFCISLGLAIAVGWIMNIVHLVGMTNILATGEGIVRVVGIFIPPLGAFMGFFY